jgi:hypothetical protein
MICSVFVLPPMSRTRTSSNPMPSTTGVMIPAMRRSMAALATRSVIGSKNKKRARGPSIFPGGASGVEAEAPL